MTATLTAAATSAPAGAPPRLTRWVLRLHRPALYAWTGLVLALAALLLALRGPLIDAAAEAWRQYDACAGERCHYDQAAILRYKDYYGYATFALNALPLLVAAWAGAALTGRELESGTALLSWTQGASPARWLTARLAVPAIAVTTGTTLLCWLHHLVQDAGDGRIDTAKPWSDRWTFHAGGPSIVALTLAGLAAGALAGLLLRRTLPGLLVGTLVAVGVRGLAELALPRLWPAVTRTSTMDQGFTGSGLTVDQGMITRTGAHVPVPACSSFEACDNAYAGFTGYWNTYHPFSHYWPLQLTTGALVLGLAALLVLGCFLALRRLTGPATATTAGRTATGGTTA